MASDKAESFETVLDSLTRAIEATAGAFEQSGQLIFSAIKTNFTPEEETKSADSGSEQKSEPAGETTPESAPNELNPALDPSAELLKHGEQLRSFVLRALESVTDEESRNKLAEQIRLEAEQRAQQIRSEAEQFRADFAEVNSGILEDVYQVRSEMMEASVNAFKRAGEAATQYSSSMMDASKSMWEPSP